MAVDSRLSLTVYGVPGGNGNRMLLLNRGEHEKVFMLLQWQRSTCMERKKAFSKGGFHVKKTKLYSFIFCLTLFQGFCHATSMPVILRTVSNTQIVARIEFYR